MDDHADDDKNKKKANNFSSLSFVGLPMTMIILPFEHNDTLDLYANITRIICFNVYDEAHCSC